MRKRVCSSDGVALIDLVFTCGLILVLGAVAIPSLHASRERDETMMAARLVAQKLVLLRIEALRRNRAAAMRFDPDDIGRFGSFADADGDGVLQADIDAGIDTRLDEQVQISQRFGLVRFGVATNVPAPDGQGVIAAESDPVRIGNSNLLSFSPVGTATSGTIYLVGRGGTQACVRVFGGTGRIRVLRFNRTTETWVQD